MTHTLQEILQQNGKLIDSLTEEQLNCENEVFCYYIVKGTVDLFLAEQLEERKNTALKPFITLNQGSFVISIPLIKNHESWHLNAKFSPNAEFIQLPYASILKLLEYPELKKEVQQLIETWVSVLTKSINSYLRPEAIELIQQEGSVQLINGTAYQNEHSDLVWIQQQQGHLSLLGNGIESKDVFPLMSKSWISSDDDALIEVHFTEHMFTGNKLLPALQSFYQTILAIVIQNIKEREAIEEKQFNQGLSERSTSLNMALRDISNFYVNTEEEIEVENRANSAIASCKLVCKNLGISINIPSEIPVNQNDQVKVNHILNNSQIAKRQVVLAGEWWKEPHGILIGFLQDTQQAVVLLFDRKKGYLLINTETGTKITVDANVSKNLVPFALSIYRSLPNQPMSLKDIMYWSLQRHKADLNLIFIISVCTGLLGLFTPWATGQIFSEVIPDASYSLLTQLLVGFLAASFGLALFEATRSFTIARILAFIDNNGVSGLWDRMTKLPLSFYQKYGSGDLLNRASGFQLIVNQIFGVAAKSIFDSTYAVFYFILLFYYSITLGLVSLGIMGFSGILMFFILKQEIKISRVSSNLAGHLSTMLAEYVSGIQKIKTTASESYVFNNWSHLFVEYRKNLFRSSLWYSALSSLHSVLPIFSVIVIFLFVSPLIQKGTMGLGSFLAFNAAFGSLLGITIRLTLTLSTVLQLIPIFERIEPILDCMPEVHSVKRDPGLIKGNIEVDHVLFKYKQNAPLILKDVSLKVAQGEFVAIVGPSGSGKSTLLRLLLQFETPLSGSIFFDDQSINDLDINMVRRQIGVVLQNSSIFPGSIFENIIGTAPLTIDDAWMAAKLAGFDRDIQNMPMGMHTIISEGSGGISGGQKQRLIIARALVNRPNLLFFDEATSALDNETQQIVTDSLNQLNATRIVVAHRLSTIIDADKIIVLVDGKVEEVGNYTELMANKGVFHKMASRQIV